MLVNWEMYSLRGWNIPSVQIWPWTLYKVDLRSKAVRSVELNSPTSQLILYTLKAFMDSSFLVTQCSSWRSGLLYLHLNKAKYKSGTTAMDSCWLILWLSRSSMDVPQRKCLHCNKQWLQYPLLSIHPPGPRFISPMDTSGQHPGRTTATCWLAPWLAVGWPVGNPSRRSERRRGVQVSCHRTVMSFDRMSQFSSKHVIFSFQLPVLLSPLLPLVPEVVTSLLILAPRCCVVCWNFSAPWSSLFYCPFIPPSELPLFECAIRFYLGAWLVKLTT